VPGEQNGRSEEQHSGSAASDDLEQARIRGTVLVVDDEEMIRVLCDAILHRLGFRTLRAIDGEDAIRVFQAHASEISAVVMDLTMPLMDGATAFKKMLQIKPDVKVILSSGYCEHDATKNLAEFSPAGFLQKPYSLRSLKAELIRVLRTSEMVNASVC
jgi:two-component system, cell cycle sensor histidine kinase and response regulator CckA